MLGLVWVMAGGLVVPRARSEGTVTNASTVALLQALQGGGTVRVGFTTPLVLETPLLIASDTVLESEPGLGRTVTISGGGIHRLFHVLPGVRLELRGLVLREGLSTNGGAILNEGVLIASNVLFAASKAVGTAGSVGRDGTVESGFGESGTGGGPGVSAAGGAVWNLGVASFEACNFSGNSASGGKGGDGGKGGIGGFRVGSGGAGGDGGLAVGGAISSLGWLEIVGSTFDGNSALGGAAGAGGSNGSVLGAGSGGAGGDGVGGAIHSAGWLSIVRSSLATNLASGGAAAAAGAPGRNIGGDGARGGSAWGGALATWSTGMVVNTTFYTNLVVGGRGGDGAAGTFTVGSGGRGGFAVGAGIHGRGSLALTNLTWAWNSGTNGAGGSAGGGGGSKVGDPGYLAGSALAVERGTVAVVVNSILASGSFGTVDGPVTDGGHNLFTDDGTGVRVAGSVYRSDAGLGAYQVWTTGPAGLVPLSGSPAEGGADPARAPLVDQRGIGRPLGRGPDMGALEVDTLSYFVEGQVLDGEEGVAGVSVAVGTNVVVVTDAKGVFRAGPLKTGYYVVGLVSGAEAYQPRLAQVPVFSEVTNLVFRAVRPTVTLAHSSVDGADVLTSAAVAGRTYRLEGSDDLNAWTALETVTADASGKLVFKHRPGPVRHWFYRVSRP